MREYPETVRARNKAKQWYRVHDPLEAGRLFLATEPAFTEPRKRPMRPPRGYRGERPTPTMRCELSYRAHDPCAYCGAPSEHWDHMESRHRGGWNTPDNLIRACKACNVNKRTRSPLMYLALRRLGHRR